MEHMSEIDEQTLLVELLDLQIRTVTKLKYLSGKLLYVNWHMALLITFSREYFTLFTYTS